MSRRSLMLAAMALPLPAFAAPPFQTRVFNGGRMGGSLLGGLHITLDKGWKTYWKMPGAGGVPPDISVKGENVASFTSLLPLPLRIAAPEGEVIGYKDEVVFLFKVLPHDAQMPCVVNVDAFVGVCDTVCIPVTVTDKIELNPAAATTAHLQLAHLWMKRIPTKIDPVGQGIVATAVEHEGKPHLAVTLPQTAPEFFVSGQSQYYFARPLWTGDNGRALVRVAGAASIAELRGTSVSISYDAAPAPLEVTVTVV